MLTCVVWSCVQVASAAPAAALKGDSSDTSSRVLPAGSRPDPAEVASKSPRQPLQVAYRIDARIDLAARRLSGTVHIHLVAPVAVEAVPVWMFPALLGERDPHLNDLSFPRVYPHGFEPAAMTFQPRWNGTPLEVLSAPLPPGWTPGSLVNVRLPVQVPAGTPIELEGPFEVEIPRRYGTFGIVDRQLTLSGGWFPTVIGHDGQHWQSDELPEASLELNLQYPPDQSVLVGGMLLETEGTCSLPGAPDAGSEAARSESGLSSTGPAALLPRPGGWCSRFRGTTRTPLLVVGPLPPRRLEAEVPISFYDPKDRPAERRRLSLLVNQALIPWRAAGLPDPVHPMPLIRAPLRRSLTLVTPEALLLSDRALRVSPFFKRFHEASFLHALYQSWLIERLAPRERPDDLLWVSDGLAWFLVSLYQASMSPSQLNARGIVQSLSFLPSFDEMLYAPKFSFAGEFYDNPYASDPFQEDVDAWLRPGPPGRVLFMKLEDRYGRGSVLSASLDTLNQVPGRFLEQLARRLEMPSEVLDAWLEGWRRPYPSVNYILSDVKRQRVNGSWRTTFDVREQKIDRPVPDEPVSIEVKTSRDSQSLTWDGRGVKRFSVETLEPVSTIALDPKSRLLETNPMGVQLRDDNFWPARRKILFSFVPSSFDLSQFKARGAVALYLTNPHAREWLALTEVYSDSSVLLGGNLGTFRYFGPFRDTQWKVHRVGAQLAAAHRACDELFQACDAGPFLNTLGLRLSYRYESRVGLREAMNGAHLTTAVEGGVARSQVETKPYTLLSVTAIKPWAIHPRHVLVGRAQIDAGFGLTSGDGAAGEGLFALGGGSLLRGLALGEGVGNRRWLSSLEYRATLIQGLDVDLWAGRLRSIQMAVFTDVGGVGDDLEALGAPLVGYGVGTRLFVDIFGLKPGMIGLDLAWLTTETPEGSVSALIRLNHPF